VGLYAGLRLQAKQRCQGLLQGNPCGAGPKSAISASARLAISTYCVTSPPRTGAFCLQPWRCGIRPRRL